MKLLANKTVWYILGAIACLVALQWVNNSKFTNLEKKNEQLRRELARARMYQPIERDTIRDTIPVVSAPVSQLTAASYKKDIADEQLIKDMGLKASSISSQQTATTETRNIVTVKAEATPYVGGEAKIFAYHDQWADFMLKDTILSYAVRDSVTTYVYREYKHKFLWWRWGTKGYRVKMINFNPHSTIKHVDYIKVD